MARAIAGDERPIDTIPAAKAAADRALALEPDHPDALAVHGMIAFYFDWEFGEAERLVRRALSLQPSSYAHLGLAHILSNLGRHEEALAEIQRARALDPAWPLARSLEGQFLFLARRYHKALEHLDALTQFDPDFPSGHLIRLYPLSPWGTISRPSRSAIVWTRSTPALVGPSPGQPYSFALALRGYALAKLGKRARRKWCCGGSNGSAANATFPPSSGARAARPRTRGRGARAAAGGGGGASLVRRFSVCGSEVRRLRSKLAFDALLSRANLLDVSRDIERAAMSSRVEVRSP